MGKVEKQIYREREREMRIAELLVALVLLSIIAVSSDTHTHRLR